MKRKKLTNKSIYSFILASLLVFGSVQMYYAEGDPSGKALPESKGGIIFKNNMLEYKEPTKWYEKETNEQLMDIFLKIEAQKDSGEWELKKQEYTIPDRGTPRRFNDYPTTVGTSKDPNCHTNTLDPKHMSSHKELQYFLQKEMSQRCRLFLMGCDFMHQWPYSNKNPDRTTPYSGITDCSGYITIAGKVSGIKTPTTSAKYPGSNLVEEVPMDQRRIGDICWRKGHVEVYLGYDENGVERTVGAHSANKPAMISVFKRNSAFTKIYRLKGIDNPLTTAEIAKLNGN